MAISNLAPAVRQKIINSEFQDMKDGLIMNKLFVSVRQRISSIEPESLRNLEMI
jgi:hypothetical protein